MDWIVVVFALVGCYYVFKDDLPRAVMCCGLALILGISRLGCYKPPVVIEERSMEIKKVCTTYNKSLGVCEETHEYILLDGKWVYFHKED